MSYYKLTSGIAYAVFALPVAFSLVFGGAVMGLVLQEPDRDLNMLPFATTPVPDNEPIRILGLEPRYLASEPVAIRVLVLDDAFDCGDLYVTIRDSEGAVFTQSGFFEQCIPADGLLPAEGEFSEFVSEPGRYEIEVTIVGGSGVESAVATAMFVIS